MKNKKYESAFQKANRYRSEIESGYHLKNGKLVPMTEEEKAYKTAFVGEVYKSEYAKQTGVNPVIASKVNGCAAASNQLRKEYNFKKRKTENAIANKVNARRRKHKQNTTRKYKKSSGKKQTVVFVPTGANNKGFF